MDETDLEEIARITGVEYVKVKRISKLLQRQPGTGKLIYYTPKEVAGMMNVSEKTVRRWYGDGVIPYVNIGGSIRIPRHDLMLALKKMKR